MELLYQYGLQTSNVQTTGAQTRIVSLTTPDEAETLVCVLEEIAQELGWQPGNSLRHHLADAYHVAVLVGETVVGGLQAALGAPTGTQSHQGVWHDVHLPDPLGVLHVTMLALKEDQRGQPHLFGSLCVELWRLCVASGVHTILLEATPPTLRVYRRLGWPLEIIGDLRLHWGEECCLCRMGVQEVADVLKCKARCAVSFRALVQQAYRSQPDEHLR